MKTMTMKSQDKNMACQFLTWMKNTVSSIDSDQNINSKFKIDGINYFLEVKDFSNTRLQDRNTNATGTGFFSCICNLDPEQIRLLQQ